nr:hypothetical protein [Tanacetum cinerariifolium]
MATTLEQQVALDEALVPSAQRLRIGRSNFRLPSDIQSKEPTLQVETANLHQHSIRFKMDTKKHVLDLEAFREMLHISSRIPSQSFAELPFEEEILEFLRFLGYSTQIKTLTDVNVNKLYQPWRSFAAVINKCLTGKSSGIDNLRKPSIPRRNKVNWHYVRDDVLFSTIKVVSRHQTTQQYGATIPIELTTEDIRNSKAYKEYYACATGEAAPKPKASTRKKKGGSASSTTPPTPIATSTPTTTIVAAPRLYAAAKGKQPARATTPTEPTDVERTESKQLKINSSDDEDVDEQTQGRDESEGEKTNESDDDDQDEAKKGNDDKDDEDEISKISEQEVTESDEGDDEATESDRESKDEETREQEEESFDLIPRTPEESEDDDHNKEDPGLRIGEDERMHEEDEADEQPRKGITSMESIFTTGSTIVTPIPSPQSTMTQSIISTFTTASQLPPPPTQIPSLDLQSLPTFALVFRFEDKQMLEAVQEAVQTQTDRLQDSIQRENDEFLKTIDENMKKIIKEQRSDEQRNLYKALVEAYDADKTILDTYRELSILKRRREDDDPEGPSTGSDRGSKRQREGGEHASASTPSEPATGSAGRSTTGSQSRQLSASEFAFVEEPMQTTCQMEEPSHPVFEIGAEDQPIIQTTQHPEWFSQPRRPLTPDRDWNKTLPGAQGNAQSWISALAKQTDARSSFNELLDTLIDFSNFNMNRLGEVYKATTDQLDWVNPKGQQYPHNLLQPLPLIPDNWGRSVIPFEHFINNDLEYLWGGASSRKYTTSVTKTKVADYGHIKLIKELVPLNRESALDVYSKRRIIAVTELKIVEWHDYKHLDWISVRRDDDKIYKFKEGDFKRLRLQDIEDILLLFVQGKLSNLTVKERFAFNVSLRMFTRSIVIQRRVEDLQLGVESYQKKLNLTKPDTYRSDLKR